MPHPLVLQLRFTRNEFKRALAGVSDSDARQRCMPMNCISWSVGHLASQEQGVFLMWLQGKPALLPNLKELVGYGRPASTPPLDEMWAAWNTITAAVDPFLDTLTNEMLQQTVYDDGKPTVYTPGSLLQRVIYHYWYHIGEMSAARQMLGDINLPEFVGNIDQGSAVHAALTFHCQALSGVLKGPVKTGLYRFLASNVTNDLFLNRCVSDSHLCISDK